MAVHGSVLLLLPLLLMVLCAVAAVAPTSAAPSGIPGIFMMQCVVLCGVAMLFVGAPSQHNCPSNLVSRCGAACDTPPEELMGVNGTFGIGQQGGDEEYPPSLTCSWHLRGQEHQQLRAWFNWIDLEQQLFVSVLRCWWSLFGVFVHGSSQQRACTAPCRQTARVLTMCKWPLMKASSWRLHVATLWRAQQRYTRPRRQ